MKLHPLRAIPLLLAFMCVARTSAQSPRVAPAEYVVTQQRPRLFGPSLPHLAPVPLDVVPADLREPIAKVVRDPTVCAHGPSEEFPGWAYDWLLDHPDRVATAWRRVGVPCVAISPRDDNKYAWVDPDGSNVGWVTAFRGPTMRIWYAEGQAKAAPSLPIIPVRAVAVLRQTRRTDEAGQLLVSHEVDIYLQTDSRAAALVARLLGPAAPRMAEQGATQLLMFFSAMAKHLDDHPEQVPRLLGR
jgi:hypothetical protein